MQQLLIGLVTDSVLLQDGREPAVEILLILSYDAELFLSSEESNNMLLLEVQPPHNVVAALERQHAAWQRACLELLLRLVVFQPRGAFQTFGAKHEKLFLHRLQLPQVAVARHRAPARCAAPRHHSTITHTSRSR